jgi:hypothetical protein
VPIASTIRHVSRSPGAGGLLERFTVWWAFPDRHGRRHHFVRLQVRGTWSSEACNLTALLYFVRERLSGSSSFGQRSDKRTNDASWGIFEVAMIHQVFGCNGSVRAGSRYLPDSLRDRSICLCQDEHQGLIMVSTKPTKTELQQQEANDLRRPEVLEATCKTITVGQLVSLRARTHGPSPHKPPLSCKLIGLRRECHQAPLPSARRPNCNN